MVGMVIELTASCPKAGATNQTTLHPVTERNTMNTFYDLGKATLHQIKDDNRILIGITHQRIMIC